MIYWTYMLKCFDGTFYTGMTNSLERRVEEHIKGTDPTCYTYLRRPIQLVYKQAFQFAIDAIALEKKLKGWSAAKKQALIDGDIERLKYLSRSKKRRDRA
jgi:putative endonuclease